MSRKKPAEPPLDWLRQSVWVGEELPDELELLEELEPEPAKPQLTSTRRKRVSARKGGKP